MTRSKALLRMSEKAFSARLCPKYPGRPEWPILSAWRNKQLPKWWRPGLFLRAYHYRNLAGSVCSPAHNCVNIAGEYVDGIPTDAALNTSAAISD